MGRSRNVPGRRPIFDRLEARRLLALVLSPASLTATQGVGFDGVVATLVDTNFKDSPSTFNTPPGSVTIDWGDGSTSAGTVVGPLFPGVFEVDGAHTYTQSNVYITKITVMDQSGNDAIASGSATVTSQPTPLTVAGTTISGNAGGTLASVPVATFLDTNPSDTASDFNALIDWGDGVTTIGTVQGSNGAFSVTGTHTYPTSSNAISYTYSVTVIGLNNGLSGVAYGTANIAAATTTYTLAGQKIIGTAGVALPADTQVATFTDTNSSDTAANFSAVINWGDGHTSPGTVVSTATTGGGPPFAVEGTHAYATPGTYPVITTVYYNNTTPVGTTTGTAVVTGPVITPVPVTISPSIGQPFSGTVATFYDTNPNDSPSTLSATITWGNGDVSAGTISQVSPGLYQVQGAETYTAAGKYTISVAIANQEGQTATASSMAVVGTPTLAATGLTFPATPGAPLVDVTVANLIDTNPGVTLQAVIDWGDGQTGAGTVAPVPGAPGTFTVTGSHTYSASGSATSYPVTVTITDSGGHTATADSKAVLASVISAVGTTFTTTPGGAVIDVAVATFNDPNAGAGSSMAIISWGDGTTSQGVVSGSNGSYAVRGTHTYLLTGAVSSHPVTVTIVDPSGQTATADSTALVPAGFLSTVGQTFNVTPGVLSPITPSSGVPVPLALFTDSNPAANFSNITATINWGDGQTSTGRVMYDAATGYYDVYGQHIYSTSGTASSYKVTVTISDPSGQTATATSTALVSTLIVATGTTFPVTPGVSMNHTVATVTDANAAPTSAVIDWGDGTTSQGTISGSSPNYTVAGTHTYPASGTAANYAVTVTIVDASGQTATANSTAIVASFVSATGATFTVIPALSPSPVTVATFTDTNPAIVGGTMPLAVINWGNGQTTPGQVTFNPATGTFTVTGTPPYYPTASASSYAVTVTIIDPSGQTATASSTAIVALPGPSSILTGGLSAVVTNGPHAAMGFTNTNRPTFNGTAPPYAIVQLYARHFNADAQIPLGQAVADANGRWTFTAGPLAVGTYIFTATVTIPGGYPSGAIPLTNAGGNPNKNDLVYIDLSPRAVEWLSHGGKAVHGHHGPTARHPAGSKKTGHKT